MRLINLMSILVGYSVLTKAMIGVGILSLAHAMADAGWYCGIAISIISPLVMAFALYILSSLAADHKKKIPDALTYYNVASRLSVPAAVLLDIAIVTSSFGCAVAYSVVSGAMITELFRSVGIVLDTNLVKIVVVLFLSPFCFAKTLRRTKVINFIAIACIAYIVLYAIIMADPFGAYMQDTMSDLSYPRSWRGVVSSIPKFVFAYGCTQNLFGVANEMLEFSTTRLNVMAFSAIATAAVFNTICSVLPFLTFGKSTASNFLKNFDADESAWSQSVRAAAAFQVSVGTVLIFHPLRSSVIDLFSLSGNSEFNLRFSTSLVLLLLTLATSIWIGDDLGIVINLTGLIGNSTMSFIVPCYLYCISRSFSFTWCCSAVLLVAASLLFPLVIYDMGA